MERFIKKSLIAAPANWVFSWHEEPDAIERLTPPWERVRVVERSADGINIGTRITLQMSIGPLRQRWVAVHTAYEPGRMFRDEQVSGPFKLWVHTHSVEPRGSDCCILTDDIQYQLPLGLIGRLAGGWLVRRKLSRLFDYRHNVTKKACAREPNQPIIKNRPGNLGMLDA